jgi:hypothetical protein
MFTIERFSESWYALRGGSNWACIEGSAEEWADVASSITNRQGIIFRRLACFPVEVAGFDFWSPRNAMGESDTVFMTDEEAKEFAKVITQTLREDGHECIFGNFDPIALGC